MKSSLRKHMKVKHEEHVKWKCPKCDSSFSEKGNLNSHMRGKHNQEKYTCDICEKTISIFTKNRHKRLHEKNNEQLIKPGKDGRLQCDQCDYSARRRKYFEQHKRIEHGNTRYTCNLCDYQCKVVRYLRDHKLRFQI